MSNNSSLLKQAQQTETSIDHSKPTTGGGPRLPAPGKCPARLIGYIELGKQPQPDYKGKAKDPETEVQLVFECFGKNNMDEIEDKDGNNKTVGRIIRPLPMTMKVNERAKFYKMFKDMDYGRGLDHMSKMLNDVFRLTIEHEKSAKGTEYAKITNIESPLIEKIDPDTGDVVGETDISDKVPQASYDFQLFIVDHPTFEQWDSIFIDGTYTKKTKNEETGEEIEEEVSKNFIQEKIMSSLDWEGSAMQTLLLDLDEEPEDEVEEEVEEKPAKKSAGTKTAQGKSQSKTSKSVTKESGTAQKSATKSPSKKEEPEDTDAMLDELGL